jgi:hypothetical protein
MVPKSAQTSELVARFADYPGALEALVHAITVQVLIASAYFASFLSVAQRHRSAGAVGISCFGLFPSVSNRI